GVRLDKQTPAIRLVPGVDVRLPQGNIGVERQRLERAETVVDVGVHLFAVDLPVGVDLLRRALPDHDREYATIRQSLRYERRRVVRLAAVETQNNLSPRLELEKVFILQHASIPLRLGEQRVLLGDDLV